MKIYVSETLGKVKSDYSGFEAIASIAEKTRDLSSASVELALFQM